MFPQIQNPFRAGGWDLVHLPSETPSDIIFSPSCTGRDVKKVRKSFPQSASGEDISKSEQLRMTIVIEMRGTYVLGSLVQASLVDTPKDRGDRMTRALTTRTAPGRALPPHDPHGPSLTHGSRAGVGAGFKPALPVAVASRRLHATREEPALSLPKGVSHPVSFVSHSASLVSYSASVVSRTVSQAKAERDTMRQDKTHIGDFFSR